MTGTVLQLLNRSECGGLERKANPEEYVEKAKRLVEEVLAEALRPNLVLSQERAEA